MKLKANELLHKIKIHYITMHWTYRLPSGRPSPVLNVMRQLKNESANLKLIAK
jgi:hypothetical protein